MAKNLLKVVCLAGLSFAPMSQVTFAQEKMPREDVVDVPAIGEGLCVSNVFQTNMVLQREKRVPVWGWAKPGAKVVVSFADATVETTAAEDRTWKVVLPSMAASASPRALTVTSGDARLTLDNILVGDVWVLGGQSNMEFPLSRVENGELEIVSANFANMRILTVPAADGADEKPGIQRLHEWSGWFGRHYRKGDWDVCTPEIARELSAIGYVFARRLHMTSQVPIGVIDASRGGTTVETWTPDSVLRKIDTPEVTALLTEWDQKVDAWDPQADLAQRVENFKRKVERFEKEGRKLGPNDVEPTDLRPGPAMDQNRPGNCYASMIAPLRGMAVKGAIFHQGYNNCFNGSTGAVMYRQVFPQMIAAWRDAFGDPELPFGILSLCTEGQKQTLENYSEMMANPGPYIREAQYQTFLELYQNGDKNIGFASCYDLRRRWYHPQLKLPAGERLARWALATQYGVGNLKWKPPILLSSEVVDSSLVLTLDEAAAAVDDGGPIVGFAIAGEDRNFHPATAEHFVTGKDDRGRPKTDNRRLVLSSPMVPQPVHFRYAWGRSPLGNLQVSRNTDVPFATQRSDDWPLEATPLLFGEETPAKLDGRQKRQQQEALRQLDEDRRKGDAQRLLQAASAGR
ncbi:MAG: hypothetical protein NXI04_13615 [Planctomycetaceae bacterium]|nr:hypothetical protein [Planctomycetaceae bacterium]